MPFQKEAIKRPDRPEMNQYEDIDAYYSALSGADDVPFQNETSLPNSSANIFNITR